MVQGKTVYVLRHTPDHKPVSTKETDFIQVAAPPTPAGPGCCGGCLATPYPQEILVGSIDGPVTAHFEGLLSDIYLPMFQVPCPKRTCTLADPAGWPPVQRVPSGGSACAHPTSRSS